MTSRGIGWAALVAVAAAVSWLWPRIDRPPTDYEIAIQHLKEQQPGVALLFFKDTAWRGVAAYRDGRYAQATREFSASETVLSLYNLGNSYAHLRDWPNAIASYQRVLRFEPDHADALHNLGLVQIASELASRPVEPADEPEQQPPENDTIQLPIPQESNSEQAQKGKGEESETAGNTSDTDEVGNKDPTQRPRPVQSVGEVGSAGAVGEASEEPSRQTRLVGGVVDMRPRMSTRPAEVLVRKIEDDPEKVLRARLRSVYDSRIVVK